MIEKKIKGRQEKVEKEECEKKKNYEDRVTSDWCK